MGINYQKAQHQTYLYHWTLDICHSVHTLPKPKPNDQKNVLRFLLAHLFFKKSFSLSADCSFFIPIFKQIIMLCRSGVNTCLETSLWENQAIKVLADGGPLPAQMFGWNKFMKSTEDSTSVFPQLTSIYPFTTLISIALNNSVITPLYIAPTLLL